MTWALAKVTKFFALCMSLRNSLKILKKVSISEDSQSVSADEKRQYFDQCSGILMFWTIFAVTVVCEQYFEFLIQWFPLYYYAKTFFILFMAFPRLRFTEYVFYKVFVPSIEFIHDNIGNISAMTPGEILLLLCFKLVFVCLPMISHPDLPAGYDEHSMPETELVQSDNDSVSDVVDVDSMPTADDKNETEAIDATWGGEIIADEKPRVELESVYMFFAEKHHKECAKVSKLEEDDFFLDEFESNDDGFTLNLPDISIMDKQSTDSKKINDKKSEPKKTKNVVVDADEIYESPSRVLRSFRRLLTGDSNTRLSDTVFNLDLHSPPTNTQYRTRRRSALNSQSLQQPDVSQKNHRFRSRIVTSDDKFIDDKMNRLSKNSDDSRRRRKALTPERKRKDLTNMATCYSPLHSQKKPCQLNKENIFRDIDAEDSLDSLLSDENESNVTVRRRRKKLDIDDEAGGFSDIRASSRPTSLKLKREAKRTDCMIHRSSSVDTRSCSPSRGLYGLRRSRVAPEGVANKDKVAVKVRKNANNKK